MSNRNDTFAVFAVHDQMTMPAAIVGTDTGEFGCIAEFAQFHSTVNGDRAVVFHVGAISFKDTTGIDDQLSGSTIHTPQVESLVAVVGSNSHVNFAVNRNSPALIVGTGKSNIADNLDLGTFSKSKVAAHIDKTVDYGVTFAFGLDRDALSRTEHTVRSVFVTGSQHNFGRAFGQHQQIAPAFIVSTVIGKFSKSIHAESEFVIAAFDNLTVFIVLPCTVDKDGVRFCFYYCHNSLLFFSEFLTRVCFFC